MLLYFVYCLSEEVITKVVSELTIHNDLKAMFLKVLKVQDRDGKPEV